MPDLRHETIVALFESHSQAEAARGKLAAGPSSVATTELLAPGDSGRLQGLDEVDAREVAKDAATGAALGALGGAGGAAVAGLTLLATAPVAAALVGAGIGAASGGVGATAGSAALRRPVLVSAVREALANGRHALLVAVDGEAQALEVQDLLERTAALKVIDRHGGQHAVSRDAG